MHISLARKHCKVSMKYYNERMATLARNFPQVYPFEIKLETRFSGNDFPITYITAKRFNETVKTWVLVVDSSELEGIDDSNSQVQYINLQKIASWRKAKRYILEEIKKEVQVEVAKEA